MVGDERGGRFCEDGHSQVVLVGGDSVGWQDVLDWGRGSRRQVMRRGAFTRSVSFGGSQPLPAE